MSLIQFYSCKMVDTLPLINGMICASVGKSLARVFWELDIWNQNISVSKNVQTTLQIFPGMYRRDGRLLRIMQATHNCLGLSLLVQLIPPASSYSKELQRISGFSMSHVYVLCHVFVCQCIICSWLCWYSESIIYLCLPLTVARLRKLQDFS